MKKILIGLALVAGLLIPSLVKADLATGIPNGIAVGTNSGSTRIVLTGTAYTYLNIPIADVKLNDGYTQLASVSISTGAYFGPTTGVTNTPCVTLPAVTGSGGSVNFQVPYNYRSGGVLEVLTHVHTTITLGQVSLTADVYIGQSNGLTSVAKTAGTAIQVPVNSLQVFNWVSLTNGATYVPGDSVSVKILPTGTTARVEIIAIRWKYRPYGVIDGTTSFVPWTNDRQIAVWMKRTPILG